MSIEYCPQCETVLRLGATKCHGCNLILKPQRREPEIQNIPGRPVCAHPGCQKIATMAKTTKSTENWFCRDHFWE